MSYFPKWQVKTSGVIAPDETLPANQTIALGIQHVVAMFGSTILAPILMGFDPNVAVLMSGIGTLIFFLMVGGRVPASTPILRSRSAALWPAASCTSLSVSSSR